MKGSKIDKNDLDILLVYPQLGSFDNILKDIPLSLIYAAAHSVKNQYNVKILDLRSHPHDWEQQLDLHLQKGCSLVGLSVMTGNPITTSLKISKYVKEKYKIPVVWGGPHPTILPEQTLENDYIDFVIRDWGSVALFKLIEFLKGKSDDIKTIAGLGYKNDDQIILNENQDSFEMLHHEDLPYHLVDIDGSVYNRLNNGEIIFPIFTSMGCPYKCTFCISPSVYKKIKGKKWVTHEDSEVLNHIDHLLKRYQFSRIQIYDDDSFVDLNRMNKLLKGYIDRGFHKKLKLDFRGVRINELDKMDLEYLDLMVEANVELMAIGVESGSDEMLRQMKKGITREQIIRVNQKLAKYPSLKPHYNFFCGVPGETFESLIETKDLLIQLVKDNPNCYLGVGADWKPHPGSAMTDWAVRDYALKLPNNLIEWAAIDSFDAKKIVHPWYTKQVNSMIKLLQIAGQLLDRKIIDHRKSLGFTFGWLISIAALIYRPILSLRLKYNFSRYMIEYDIKDIIFKYFAKNYGK